MIHPCRNTPRYSFILLSVLTTLSCNDDSAEDTRPMRQEECQLRCEEEYAADLAHPDCIACDVSCLLAENALTYTCVFEPCTPDRCTEHCAPTEYPIGLCNHVSDEGVYWGCNCFSSE